MRKKTASSVPEDKLQESGPEMPERSNLSPAEFGSPPGDRYPTPKPEEARRRKSRRNKRKKPHQEATELQQVPCPLFDGMDLAVGPDDGKGISSKSSGDGLNTPGKEVIDLTIKEESRSATPISLAQPPGSNEGPAGLEAGWVCSFGILDLHALTRKKGSFLPLNDISCSTDTRKLYSTIGVVTHAREVTETRTGGT